MAFDPLVANAGRLSILSTLAAGAHDFVRLRSSTHLTDGNLAAHARRLASAGLIHIEKRIAADKPVTTYLLTDAGRLALQAHVDGILATIRIPESLPPTPEPQDDWVD